MPKVMLVEDDNNLREIYDARLAAEGYEIVSAHDGEEALALAVKERPDLIISDVMMPKISGFDMLDILRTTPETKNVKVIMMTALSQAEDRARADKLGADRYLIKSQVTLEDVIKVAHEVLEDTPVNDAPSAVAAPIATVQDLPVVSAPPEPAASTDPAPAVPVATDEPADQPAPIAEPPTDEPSVPARPTPAEDAEKQIQDFLANNPAPAAQPTTLPASAEPSAPETTKVVDAPQIQTDSNQAALNTEAKLSNPEPTQPAVINAAESTGHKKLILTPTETATQPTVDLDDLLKKEEAKSSDTNPNDIAL